jgi:hypothetical protein
VHRSVALALLLKQRGFMDACDATLAPHVIPVFRDLAGSDRAAAAAEAMPKSRLVNAFVCKVGGGGGEVVLIVKVLTLLARCVTPRVAACRSMKRTSKASATPREWPSFWRERVGRGVTSDGTLFLTQRARCVMCDVLHSNGTDFPFGFILFSRINSHPSSPSPASRANALLQLLVVDQRGESSHVIIVGLS